jgi:hypothetical protein
MAFDNKSLHKYSLTPSRMRNNKKREDYYFFIVFHPSKIEIIISNIKIPLEYYQNTFSNSLKLISNYICVSSYSN